MNSSASHDQQRRQRAAPARGEPHDRLRARAVLAAKPVGERLASGSGKQPASPTPNRNRTPDNDQKPAASPVAIVKVDHQTTMRVITARGPMRSPSQPPGTSKSMYASENTLITVPMSFLVRPSSRADGGLALRDAHAIEIEHGAAQGRE